MRWSYANTRFAMAGGVRTAGPSPELPPESSGFSRQLPTFPHLLASQMRSACKNEVMKRFRQISSVIPICGLPVVCLLAAWSCSFANLAFGQTSGMQQPALEQNYQPRPYQGQLEADDGQWIRPAKDY